MFTLINNLELVRNWLDAPTEEARKQAYYDIMFRERSYATNGSFDLNPFDLAYRADTKEEYYIDLATGVLELGLAYVTGGTGRLFRATEQTVKELLELEN